MKLATTSADFAIYFDSQEESIKRLRQAGFKYIDYSFGTDYTKKVGFFSNNPKEYLEKLKALADELGVKFVQSHAPMGRPLLKDENYDSFIEANKKSIEFCSALGIKNIVVHSGYLSGLSKEETFIANKEFYDKLLPTAEKYDVNILTENYEKMCNQNYWIDNATDMKELIDFINHPLFHCCWDTGHANLHNTTQHQAMKILSKDIYAVHIQDNFGNDDHHVAPYFGTMNLDDLMKGLREIDFKGYFTFEADGMPCALWRKRKFDEDTRLFLPPVEIREKIEGILYDIGKHILTMYDCFEE